jgi:hypothetical protein
MAKESNSRKKNMKNPSTRRNRIVDPVLGKLKWDSQRLVWRGHATIADGVTVPMSIQTLSYLTQRPPFEDATWDRMITPASRDALARVRASEALLRAALTEEFFPIYSRWPDREKSMGAATFARRIKFDGVILLPDGGAQVFFDDAGMFGGHALIVHLDCRGAVTRTEMFG